MKSCGSVCRFINALLEATIKGNLVQNSFYNPLRQKLSSSEPGTTGNAMTDLKRQLIRLGSRSPELQKHLRPVLDTLTKRAGSSDGMMNLNLDVGEAMVFEAMERGAINGPKPQGRDLDMLADMFEQWYNEGLHFPVNVTEVEGKRWVDDTVEITGMAYDTSSRKPVKHEMGTRTRDMKVTYPESISVTLEAEGAFDVDNSDGKSYAEGQMDLLGEEGYSFLTGRLEKLMVQALHDFDKYFKDEHTYALLTSSNVQKVKDRLTDQVKNEMIETETAPNDFEGQPTTRSIETTRSIFKMEYFKRDSLEIETSGRRIRARVRLEIPLRIEWENAYS
jgi:hypothetical protein